MRKTKWSIFAILIALILALDVCTMLVANTRFSPGALQGAFPASDQLLAEQFARDLNEQGAQGFAKQQDLDSLSQILGRDGNIVVLDADGRILASANQSYIQGQSSLNLVASPYSAQLIDWTSRTYGYTTHELRETRLALLLDAAGEPMASFRLIHTDPAMAVGKSNPSYARLFPPVDSDDVRDLLNSTNDSDGGIDAARLKVYDDPLGDWEEDDGLEHAAPQTSQQPFGSAPAPSEGAPAKGLQQRSQEHALWEATMLRAAGDRRMVVIPSVWDGGTVVMLYHSSDALHGEAINAQNRLNRYYQIRNWVMMTIPLLIVLLALWVAQDARKRGFKPALWGVLTLIGNAITWIIYLMVRPDAAKAQLKCPNCGASPKPGYAFCPVCGHALCEKCASCGRNLEPGFHYCPGCGKPVGGASQPTHPQP